MEMLQVYVMSELFSFFCQNRLLLQPGLVQLLLISWTLVAENAYRY